MQPRNPDPNTKPNVADWFRANPTAKAHCELALVAMLRYFEGTHGYINKSKPVEYHFGPSPASYGSAKAYVTRQYTRVRFWLDRKDQTLANFEGERKTLKSATGSALYAIEFKVDTPESAERLAQFVSSNSIPGWSGRIPPTDFAGIEAAEDVEQTFQAKIGESRAMSTAERQERLHEAPKYPSRILVRSYAFVRNPVVVVEVLLRADGFCEICGFEAPFLRASDGTPYLEVHHRVFLSRGGKDTVENAFALCPNCHRKQHFA